MLCLPASDNASRFPPAMQLLTPQPPPRDLHVAFLHDRLLSSTQYVHELKHGYYGRRHIARVQPESSLSIIIDGSDNGEYGLPYFHVKTKGTSKGFKLKIKLVGVLVHGRKVNIYTLPQNQGTGEGKKCHCTWDKGGCIPTAFSCFGFRR